MGAPGWACGSGGAARPLPEMHQCPVLPPQRLDVEPACTHQDVAFSWRTESHLVYQPFPVQGSASLGRHRTRHGLALGLSQGSSPSPRPKSPSVGAQRGTHALWAAPTDCHLPPALAAGFPFPSHAQASGPRLQGLVKTTGRMGGGLKAALGLRLRDSAACHRVAPKCPVSPGLDRPTRQPGSGGGGSAHCVTSWRRMTPVPAAPKRPGLPSPRLRDSTGQRRGRPPGQLDKAQLSPNSALTAKPTSFPSPTPACTQLCPLLADGPRNSAASLSLRGAGPHWVRVWLRSKRSRPPHLGAGGHVRPRVSPSQPGCPLTTRPKQ